MGNYFKIAFNLTARTKPRPASDVNREGGGTD
jgi:hypothetical protein